MKRGIDVSTFQGKVNWAEVKADGIDFAMIKATQGRSVTGAYRDFTDSQFENNIKGATRAGVRIGVYHYLTAQTVGEAIKEAEYFLSVISPYRAIIDLWAAVDVEEDKYLPEDKTLLTQIVHAFCSRVLSDNFQPMVYTNPNYLTYRLNDVSAWPLWLALWRDKENVPSKEKYPNMKLWQWGSSSVEGIVGDVDSNFMFEEEKPVAKNSAETPSVWAEDMFDWAVDNELLLGDGNGKYRPHDALTREEACLLMARLYTHVLRDATSYVIERIVEALGGEDK